MLSNGYIELVFKTSGGYDSDGNLLQPTETLSAKVECNKKELTNRYFIDEGGRQVQKKYNVYVPISNEITANDAINADYVNLYSSSNTLIGRFEKMPIDEMSMFRTISIILI